MSWLLPMIVFFKHLYPWQFLLVLIILPLSICANDINTEVQENQLKIQYEQRIVELEQELERAHFTKVAMEDNLRSHSLEVVEKSSLWIYLLISNVVLLTTLVLVLIRKTYTKKESISADILIESDDSLDIQLLTERELDVLNLIADKKSNPEISQDLFISRNTTKTHVANILKKLEVSSRQEAARKAQELNLIKPRECDKAAIAFLSKLGVLLCMVFIGTLLKAQVVIDNQTSCSYLVKVNVLKKESCQLFGSGPLLLIKAKQQFKLPPVPQSSWIVAYGVEEIGKSIERAVLVGNAYCNFRSIVKAYGSCKVSLRYERGKLMMVEE